MDTIGSRIDRLVWAIRAIAVLPPNEITKPKSSFVFQKRLKAAPRLENFLYIQIIRNTRLGFYTQAITVIDTAQCGHLPDRLAVKISHYNRVQTSRIQPFLQFAVTIFYSIF